MALQPPALPDLSPLDELLGDFLLEGEIARTPRAVVYRAQVGRHDRPVALKVARVPSDAEELARFTHEVRLLSEVRHPHVVEVYDWGVLPGGFPFLALERLATGSERSEDALGRRLREEIVTHGWDAFYEAALQVTAGLAHIHRQGLVHLDLKPGNLGWIEPEAGRLHLKILDFGLARSLSDPLAARRTIRGTLAYMAPEVLRQEGWDPRADLYSLGMTLLELATGELPSLGKAGDGTAEEQALAAVRFHLQGEEVEPLRLRADLPEPLARVLRRLLARDPARRPASAGHLLTELGEAADRRIESAELPGRLMSRADAVLAGRMVGRDEALASLKEALTAAIEGHGRLVLVEGGEGMGKSRLLRELRLAAVLEGVRVGRSRPVGARTETLRPLAEAVGQALGETEAEPPESADPEGDERPAWRMAGQVAARLRAESTPCLLLLDDIDLADAESREALAFLAAELPTVSALVVAARRPLETVEPDVSGRASGQVSGRAVHDRLGDAEDVARLPLLPLGADEVAALAGKCLGLDEPPETLGVWLHRYGGGSPRRVQELLRHLITEEVVVWEASGWRIEEAALARTVPPPGGAPELGWRRLVKLEPGHRRVLEALAVIGGPVSLEELTELLDETPEDLWQTLSVLLARGYLDRSTEERGALWTFSQRRLGELVYADIEAEERRLLHRRFAAVLRGQAGPREDPSPAAMAEHLWHAGEREQALPWLERAAERAGEGGEHDEAAELWARAAQAADEAERPANARRARAARAEALAAAGRYMVALRVCDEVLGSGEPDAGDTDAPDFFARLWLEKGRLHARLGEHREALESYRAGRNRAEDEALEVALLHGEATALRDLGEPEPAFATARSALRRLAASEHTQGQRARLLSLIAGLFFARGDWRRSERLMRRAVWVAESRAGDLPLAAQLRVNLGNVLWKIGAWDRAETIYRRSLERSEQSHDLWGRLAALNNLGILLASLGRLRESRETLAESLAMKRRLGVWETEALTRLNLAEAEEVLGNWPAARDHCERGLALLEGQPDPADRFELLARLASLERKRGDAEAAERTAREALDGARRVGDPDLEGRCWWLLGSIDKDRRRLDRAAAYLDRAREALDRDGSPEARARLSLTRADLELLRSDDEAPVRAEEYLAAAREALAELSDRLAEGELWALEAEIAARRGDPEIAEEGFHRSVSRLEELGAPFEHARTLYRWGLSSEDRNAVQERLERALVLFDRLGAEAEARRARGALEAWRGASGVREPGETGSQTPIVLSEMMKVINSTLDLDEVLDRIMDLALERLGAERGLIVLCDPLTRELTPAVSRNLEHGKAEARTLSESVVRRVIEHGEPVVTVDALEDRRFAAVESIVAHQIRSILCVPLTIRDRRAGAIYVDHGTSRHLFGDRERDFLLAFGDQAALAIDNARLYGELEEARSRLEKENETLRREVLESHHLGRFIGKSPAIVELKKTLERVALSGATVLIRGESGTGKGLVARIVHAISPRREAPFIHFNCAALPETLAESELFGHEKGAFTGAAGRKPGRFELAQGGTIFLDEIGKISRSIQAKLLRVVEEKAFERVGGTKTLQADVRIITATNLNLEEAITAGEFREDLYYRLNIIPLVLPPLRERREDVPYLVQHFLDRISRDLGRNVPELDPAVLDLFQGHAWPGNVRELEAAIHRVLVLSPEEVLTPRDFSWLGLVGEADGASPGVLPIPDDLGDGAYQSALDRYDRQLLEAALEQCDGKLREASRVLGISRNTLKAKMGRYGMRR